MKRNVLVLFLFSTLFLACKKQNKEEKPLFDKIQASSLGINFKNTLLEKDSLNILDYLYFYNGAGVSAGDINNDGLVDLYFVSNNGENKLYLNKGANKQPQFEDITQKAGVKGSADWQTGVTMADVNGDGFLDIYVSAVSKYRNLKGHNELYINNGNLTFTEKSKEYGVDFQGFSTQAAFIDYDHDGDLDMYLLNHAVHTVSSYDKVSARALRNNEAGDFLFQNNNGKSFTDVSQKAGIYGAAMGYGLGIAVADFNNDGWDDMYISNDFHEDDYYYINNQNGTFSEKVKENFDHLSRFSMGNDAADVNNDGYIDILTTDMYPEDETVEKASVTEDPLDIYLYKLRFGFYKQFSRNSLQLNEGGKKFTDIALMAGVGATDWSWSPLFADFDNDGLKDLFISNGIKHRPNNLDYVKYITDTTMNPLMTNQAMKDALGPIVQTARKIADKKAIDYMPDGKVHNYIFKGTKNLQFEDKSLLWGFDEPTYSNGAVYADLDNDGDLEIITNELFEEVKIWKNNSRETDKNNFLTIELKGEKNNTFGIGAKIIAKHKGTLQLLQNQTSRGFMSSVEPIIHLGLGKETQIDTLAVIWATGKMELLTNVKTNQRLQFFEKNATKPIHDFYLKENPLFQEIVIDTALVKHTENPYYDFSRESLMPFKVSTEGPKLAIADVNGDNLQDIYMPGSKFNKGKLFFQQANGRFLLSKQPSIEADSLAEDVAALFLDVDNDKDLDLYVVSGGNEYFDNMEEQLDRIYVNDGKGNFSRNKKALPAMFANKSCVKAADFDNDGDLDIFVGGRVVPYHYGKTPTSYLLINNGKGIFENKTRQIAPEMQEIGLVTDAQWIDIDNDKDNDLVVVGDWMPLSVFKNEGNKLLLQENSINSKTTNGFWQTIEKIDIDNDGAMDLVVGNLGMNNKFIHDKTSPLLKMFVGDFDKNDKIEQVLAYNKGNKMYPVNSKDELGKQMPSIINKKFTEYKAFAGKTIQQIFEGNFSGETIEKEVNCYASVLLKNDGKGQFNVIELPREAQVSKIFAMHVTDVNNDGKKDVIIGGNFYNVSTYQGIYDGFRGLLLTNKGGRFESVPFLKSNLDFRGEVRDIQAITLEGKPTYIIARNGSNVQFFRKTNSSQ